MTDVAFISMDRLASDSTEMSHTSTLSVDFQFALLDSRRRIAPPSERFIAEWARQAYAYIAKHNSLPTYNEVTVRLVELSEMTDLNRDYRAKNKPTNVLSFPFDALEGVEIALLGDIVICHDVVVDEAEQENKTLDQHYAHMLTHGILHLCGYDHQCDESADEMEALEAEILALSSLPNPYAN